MGSEKYSVVLPQTSEATAAHSTALVVRADSQENGAAPSGPEGYQRVSADDKSSWSLLLYLPVDILLMINDQLPPLSKAFLALTCKPLYQQLSFVFDQEPLAWGQLLSLEARDTSLIGGQMKHPRTQLLLHLEDRHWLYCSACRKLHPTTHFRRSSKSRHPSRRFCGIERWGIVDLCACLALTIANGRRLVEWLQTGAPCPTLHPNIREPFQFHSLEGRRLLRHTCSVTGHSEAFVRLVMEATLDKYQNLIVTTKYHIRWHALGWVYKLYIDSSHYCHSCGTIPFFLKCTDDGFYWVVLAMRNLGGQYRWYKGSRMPINSILTGWYPYNP
ncbi:hypothetical protein BJY00DRAFT_18370 [Aspergillus carlsbadensis]|nr:hypothetical protein BJY00DRAFT_18370 [Aspergillus carlsbadensis]